MYRSFGQLMLSALLVCSQGAIAEDMPRQSGDEASSERLELPAGGLVFVPDERLSIESEEILLARDRTHVTYTIRNRSSDRIVRSLAWPLPEIDMNVIADGQVDLPDAVLRNFSRAEVTIDGTRAPLQFEARATAFARDLTQFLQEAGLPLHPMAPGLETMMKALPEARVSELEERGAILRDEGRILPNWAFNTTAFWRQAFEPGKAHVLLMDYQPVAGADVWRTEMRDEWRQTYCIDKAIEAEIASRSAKTKKPIEVKKLTYSMANEPGWSAAVPRFKLAIEKARVDTLVATCWPGLRPTGPTLLVSTRRDFKPNDDIRVLFLD